MLLRLLGSTIGVRLHATESHNQDQPRHDGRPELSRTKTICNHHGTTARKYHRAAALHLWTWFSSLFPNHTSLEELHDLGAGTSWNVNMKCMKYTSQASGKLFAHPHMTQTERIRANNWAQHFSSKSFRWPMKSFCSSASPFSRVFSRFHKLAASGGGDTSSSPSFFLRFLGLILAREAAWV